MFDSKFRGGIILAKQPKTKTATQLACLVWRVNFGGGPEVLLVTSRDTGRWVLPKGWPMKGKKPYEAAQIEAFEEAGALGKISKKPIGSFEYFKRFDTHFELCQVKVFPLRFVEQTTTWRELGQRSSRWMEPETAAELVDEPGLKSLLLSFARHGVAPKKQKQKKLPPQEMKKAS